MFVLARIGNDGKLIFCEQDGEGIEYSTAYDFGTFENALEEQKSYPMYDHILVVQVKYEVKSFHKI
jgi:hypothetical protein